MNLGQPQTDLNGSKVKVYLLIIVVIYIRVIYRHCKTAITISTLHSIYRNHVWYKPSATNSVSTSVPIREYFHTSETMAGEQPIWKLCSAGRLLDEKIDSYNPRTTSVRNTNERTYTHILHTCSTNNLTHFRSYLKECICQVFKKNNNIRYDIDQVNMVNIQMEILIKLLWEHINWNLTKTWFVYQTPPTRASFT